jgi:23S rRNA (uracil1939-C5)-methyltransferase
MEPTPVTLSVERPVAGGDMLARHDGRVVFVRGVIPGERVLANITRQVKGVSWAEVVEILEPSPDRREPSHDPACGGGYYAHIAPARQRALKAEIIADAFRRIGKHPLSAPVAVAPSPEEGYRLRARLHVRGRRAGFFREGTHTPCDAAPSGQLRAETLDAVARLVASLGVHADHCDVIIVAEDVAARSLAAHLEPARGMQLGDLGGLDSRALLASGVTGVTTIAGRQRVVLAGTPTVTDRAFDLFDGASPIGDAPVWTRHATSFFQGNRFLMGALVTRVLDATANAQTIGDLYSGVGLFAVALAARGSRVVAVEGDESSGGDLVSNAEPWKDRLEVWHSSVEHATTRPSSPTFDAVVVDPPRTGMSPEAVKGLGRWRPSRVVYVSCDPPTLARDAAALISSGYTLVAIDAYDMFPNTPHVETVAVFDATSPPRS